MKVLLLFICLSLVSAGNLQIHIFNVGNADSQLLLFPSGFSILIDAGEPTAASSTSGKYLAKKLQTILGKKKIDVFVLTHYHCDHHGARDVGGVWYLLEKAGFSFTKFVTRNIGSYSGSTLAGCNKSTFAWKYVGEYSVTSMKFACYANSMTDKTKLSSIREIAQRCSKTQIAPPDSGATVQIINRDAGGLKDANGKLFARNSMNEANPVAENDFSVCLRITFGKFVYSTCGDISGKEYVISGGTHKYNNIESKIAKYMGEVDLLHVNHHGVVDATNSVWANTLKPTVAISSKGADVVCPAKSVMTNLGNVGAKVYNTNNCKDVGTYSYFTEMSDDVVVIVPAGGSTFTITNSSGGKKKTFNIKKSKAPVTCA